MSSLSKPILILVLLVLLFGGIFLGFEKVKALEFAQKELSLVPLNTLQTFPTKLQVSATEYVLGESRAPLTIIEYSDFECPQCQDLHPLLMLLLKNYSGKVRLISRLFPLPQNKNAEKEAEAALCAGALGGNGMYWKYADGIFSETSGTENGMGFPLSQLVPLAKKIGLSPSQFASCISSGKFAAEVAQAKKQGESLGVHALPALFFVKGGKTLFLSGNQPYPVLQAVTDEQLASF